MSSRELCPGPRRSSLELVDGGQLPDSGFMPATLWNLQLAGVRCTQITVGVSDTQVQAGVQSCSRGWGMRGARTRDPLLAQVPPSIVMSRWSGIALSDSRADLPRTTMLMPAHLRGAKQGDGLTGRQWRREWAKDGAKPPSPADRSTRPLEPIQRKSRFTPGRSTHWGSPMWGGRGADRVGNALDTPTSVGVVPRVVGLQ